MIFLARVFTRYIVENKFSLQIKTDLNLLPSVLAWFNEQRPVSMPERIWIQVQTALAEGLTNAIRHAHRQLPAETLIDIEVTISEQTLEVNIWDEGPAFDLNEKLPANLGGVDPEQIGGRGLFLMQRLCDTVNYTRSTENRNCLHLVKNITPAV